MEQHVDHIHSYQHLPGFFGDVSLLTTVKNFDLQSIRARYLASKNSGKGRTGSVERRKVSEGGLVAFRLKGGICEHDVLAKLPEPRGIGRSMNALAFSSEAKVYVLENTLKIIENPWFSYIHTVDFSPDGRALLISSSGFDVLFEYDMEDHSLIYEWWAWEHGFHQGVDPSTGERVRLTRTPLSEDVPHKVIADPLNDVLPTAMRAAFINSAEYDHLDPGYFLATFFHEGKCYRIDRESGTSEAVISDMKNPHGGQRYQDGFLATSTRSGEVVIMKSGIEHRYDFSGLPHKAEGLEGEEWLQNSKVLSDGTILTIDSNRTHLVLFHPERKVYDLIPYPDHLAIQDLIICTPEELATWRPTLSSL